MRQEFSTGSTNTGKQLFKPVMPDTQKKQFSYDKSLIALSSSWGGVIADLRIQVGALQAEIEPLVTPPHVSSNGNWVHIVGNSEGGNFNIYMPSTAAAGLLQLSHEDLDISKLEGGDAALILDHLLTDTITYLEEMLGTSLMIETITDVTRPMTNNLLGFELAINGETHTCALSLEGDLHNVVESIVAPFSFPEEKQLDGRMIVHLGPVVLPKRQAYLARIGEMINCGVEPSDVIKGVLMRADGRYWPIHIEDEKIEIVGQLAEAVDFSKHDQDNVFVTFGLGDVTLSAYDRKNIQQGSTININRLPNNTTNIYYQARPFGKGHLSILGNNLAVTLDSVGTFVA